MEELKKIEVIDEGGPSIEEGTKKRFRFKPRIRFNKGLFKKKWFLGLVIGLVILFLATFIPGVIVLTRVQAVYQESMTLMEAVKGKDLELISEKITSSKDKLKALDSALIPLAWTRFIPFIGAYEADAVHLVRAGEASLEAAEIIVQAIEPYADIIGFAGGEEQGGGEKGRVHQG